MVAMAGFDLPSKALRHYISSALHVIVQLSRMSDGSRKVTSISEVCEVDGYGFVEVRPIFEYEVTGTTAAKVHGEFYATGYLPSFIEDFVTRGLVDDSGPFL